MYAAAFGSSDEASGEVGLAISTGCVCYSVGGCVCVSVGVGGRGVGGSLVVVVVKGVIQCMVAFSGCCLSQDACWSE